MRLQTKLIMAGVGAAIVTAAVSPWRIADPAAGDAIAAHLAQAMGLNATVSGPITFKLLPRPRIQTGELSIADPDGALLVDAPVLRAEIDVPSLLRGRWSMTTATLIEPTITLDLDRLAARRRPVAGPTIPVAEPWQAQLRVKSGLIRTKSSTAFADVIATGIDAAATWPDNRDGVVFSGTSTWRGTTVQFAGSLDSPTRAFTPEGSSGSLQVGSPIFSFAAAGRLSGGTQGRFIGHLAASTPALPRLLRALDGFPVAITARRAQISGDIVAKARDLSLSNAQIRLDRSKFEGTLAMRRENGRDLVEGTLATDLLDVDALIGDAAKHEEVRALYRQPLDATAFTTDVDLRVSASAARIGRLSLGDAAVAALLRAGRLELTLDEAGAYGGLIKARAIANIGQGGLEAHAELSATRVDLGQLSGALSGQHRVGGALTGQAVLDGRGASFSDLVSGLGGHGQVTIDDGRLAGLSLGHMLRRLGQKVPFPAEHNRQPTTFDRASWGFSVDHGILSIPEGKLTAPGLQMSFGARTALPDGRIDIHAVAAQTDSSGVPVQGSQRLPFDMRGSWDEPVVMVGHSGGMALPSLPFPFLVPAPTSP